MILALSIKSRNLPRTNEDFYKLEKLNGTVRECDSLPTIIDVNVVPLPFDVLAEVISDNRRCPGGTINNGEVNVLAEDGSVISSSDYTFEWNKIKSPADSLAGNTATVTNLDAGSYYVIVRHATYSCASNADTVQLQKIEDWPATEAVTAVLISDVSSCTPGTADGSAWALINGAAIDEADYKIEWVDEQDPNQAVIAVGDTATGMAAKLYKVTVTNRLTGCSSSQLIDMSLPIPTLNPPAITHLTNCSPYNGSITATVDDGSAAGTTAGYSFRLINQDTQDTTFQSNGIFAALNAGYYNVTAINDLNQCGSYASGVNVQIEDQSGITDATFTSRPQTACKSPYTGGLTAIPTAAGTYSYVWYRGTVTQGPTAFVVGNAAATPDTLSTYITDVYTVVITDSNTGCKLTKSTTLPENITPPVLANADATITPLTSCNPTTPNGAIDVSVGGNKADYIFPPVRRHQHFYPSAVCGGSQWHV